MNRTTAILAAAAVAAIAVPTIASANDADIRSTGKCSATSTSKIKVKPRDGGLEVEFEVDQNVNGVNWKVKLKDNSNVVFRGNAVTKGPSGSFSIERNLADQAGRDDLKGVGRNPVTGERCVATVSI